MAGNFSAFSNTAKTPGISDDVSPNHLVALTTDYFISHIHFVYQVTSCYLFVHRTAFISLPVITPETLLCNLYHYL